MCVKWVTWWSLLAGPGVAGYLTAGTGATVMPIVPPPVDNDIGDQGWAPDPLPPPCSHPNFNPWDKWTHGWTPCCVPLSCSLWSNSPFQATHHLASPSKWHSQRMSVVLKCWAKKEKEKDRTGEGDIMDYLNEQIKMTQNLMGRRKCGGVCVDAHLLQNVLHHSTLTICLP